MDKTKHKTPPKNFFRYLLDEYILFRRDFVIETTASVEDCVRCIANITQEKQGCMQTRHVKAKICEISGEHHFTLLAEELDEDGGYNAVARAEGTISSSDNNVTFVSGKATINLFGLLIVLAFMIGFLVVLRSIGGREFSILVLLFYGTVIIWWWITMYKSRNYLLKVIQAAIVKAKSNKITEKIKLNDIYETNNPSSINNVR